MFTERGPISCTVSVARRDLPTACLPVILKPPSPSRRAVASSLAVKMFMLKKKKPQVDTSKQMKAVAWDLSKIALVFVGIRAASVFLNQEN
ncbi:unnamed protein product [Phytophthora fragariaefolia]|uniref:Unnamed protein product n=1 Tax=Phytophthora fragariaefolia TaxID=1490495 RepID=A0A9W7DA64_9STRA|nr:unnamed protein product [Phytophthora fragariaefolia]